MAARPSVKVVKTFLFKDQQKRWSNRYHFNGGTPADTAHWNTLFDAIVLAEKACMNATHTIVECVGYAAGSDVPVASKNYSTVGTLATSGSLAPGECCALVRYSTTARTSKNHPIYLFNYYHGILRQVTPDDPDKVAATTKTAMGVYAAAWISGFSDGTITAVRAGPNGATATGHFEETYVTHRDFPYSRSA